MAPSGVTDLSPAVGLAVGLCCAVSFGALSLVEFRVVVLRPDWGNVTPQLAAVWRGTLAAASLGSFGLSVYSYTMDDETDERRGSDLRLDRVGFSELEVETGDESTVIFMSARTREGDESESDESHDS